MFCCGPDQRTVPRQLIHEFAPVYNWEWAVTLASPGDLFTGSNEASIKASFVTPAGGNGGITSEDITLQPGTLQPDTVSSVPEPSTLMLLGTGVLGIAGAIKRRFLA